MGFGGVHTGEGTLGLRQVASNTQFSPFLKRRAPKQRAGGLPRFRSDNHRRGNYSRVFALQPRTPTPPPHRQLALSLISNPFVLTPGEYCKSRFCGSLPRLRGRTTDPHHCATLIQMHICQIAKKKEGKKPGKTTQVMRAHSLRLRGFSDGWRPSAF